MMNSKIKNLKLLIISFLTLVLAFSLSMFLWNNYASAAATYELKYEQDSDEKVVTGIEITGEGDVEVAIPDKVTKIDEGAFIGKSQIKSVTFTDGSGLVEIGDRAFLGTGITSISLPASLEKIGESAFNGTGIEQLTLPENLVSIGAGAFSECDDLYYVTFDGSRVETIGAAAFGNCPNLKFVILPENATEISFIDRVNGKLNGNYGGQTFNGSDNAYVIVKDKAQYDAFTTEDTGIFEEILVDDLEDEDKIVTVGKLVLCNAKLAFPVSIYYMREMVLLGEEVVLSANYTIKYTDKVWKETGVDKIGPDEDDLNEKTWYYNAEFVNNVARANAILAKAGDLIIFNTYDDVAKKEFKVRTDLVYDKTKSYDPTSELNELLLTSGDLVTSAMQVSITRYDRPNGNQGTIPAKIHNAGKYYIRIQVAGGADVPADKQEIHDIEIVIAQQEVNIGDYDQLSWRVKVATATQITTGLSDSTIYVYARRNGGGYFPSNNILSAEQIQRLQLNATTPDPLTVLYSTVRSTGYNNTVSIIESDAFTVSNYSGTQTAAEVGQYEVTAQLTANENYKLVSRGLTDLRKMEVKITNNGASATVVKTWYIVNVSNYLVADGTDNAYSLSIGASYTFGHLSVPVPKAKYGNNANINITLELAEYGRIGSFTPDTFSEYINNSMPAGTYTMRITVGETTSNVEDESGNVVQERHASFVETYTFIVTRANLISLTNFNTAINKKTFTYEWNEGEPHYFEQSQEATDAWKEYLEYWNESVNVTRAGVWTNNDLYGSYYGTPVIEYSLTSENNSSYYASVATGGAETYKVYYKISAPNYVDSIDSLSGGETSKDYYFTVVNVRTVSLPVIASKVYNGAKLTADISIPVDVDGNSIYRVTSNEGGINAATYTVVLTLSDPVHYMWEGQTLADKTASDYSADISINFVIEKYRDNYFTTTLGITTWTQGKYNELEEFPLVAAVRFGSVTIELTSTENPEEPLYTGENGTEELNNILKGLKAGSYIITATVAGSDNYNDLSSFIIFQVFEKDGLPWWAVLIIVVGVLGIVALVFFILHQKGTLQLLMGKVVIAMRAKATVDATIAAVRASKVAAEAKKTVAKAEALDRIEALRAAHKEEKLKPADEQAANLEEKAQLAAKSAELMQKRTDNLLRRAEAIKQQNAPASGWNEGTNDGSQTPPENGNKNNK